MKRKSIVAVTFVFALACAAVSLPAPGSLAQAQSGCQAIHGFVQATLPTSNQFAPTDVWGGPVYVNLGGDILLGGLSGNDGTQLGQGSVSIFKGGSYKLCLAGPGGAKGDCHDSFTYEVPNAFVLWPSADRLGLYTATASIGKGTGRFQSASGHLTVGGPFILWPDIQSPVGVYGRWNGELNGSICGVQ